MTSARVTIVCDSPRHPTKVAKLATYVVTEDGAVSRTSSNEIQRMRKEHRAEDVFAAFRKGEPWDSAGKRLPEYESDPKCKLCGAVVPSLYRIGVTEAIAALAVDRQAISVTLSELHGKLRN